MSADTLKEIAEGIDIHSYTAASLYKVKASQVTAKQRRIAKSRNFMAMYTPGSRVHLTVDGMSQAYTDAELFELQAKVGASSIHELVSALNKHFNLQGDT